MAVLISFPLYPVRYICHFDLLSIVLIAMMAYGVAISDNIPMVFRRTSELALCSCIFSIHLI